MQDKYEALTAYYLSSAEQYRFEPDKAHNIEFVTTMHLLLKHLPRECSVLDCCAAGGAYAFPLAKAGYKVTAGDLMENHVEILKEKNEAGLLDFIYQGDALDMPLFADKTFDTVLCMGALYHLHEQSKREKCVAECLRVLKKGGLFAFAYINRNATYINHFLNNLSGAENRKNILKTGANRVFYAMDFGESQALADKFPLQKITDAGVDGLIYPIRWRLNEADPADFADYMEYHLATCEQESIIGHSTHGLWIGRKL